MIGSLLTPYKEQVAVFTPDGSKWAVHDGDKWGPHGGRLYVTCMCVYMLEIYYRHLPLYNKGALGGR